MSQSIHVAGATAVNWGNVTLGQTDDNDDLDLEIELGEKKIHTNSSGPIIPALIIDLGQIARITIPLISYDDTQLNLAISRGATLGKTGTLGAAIPFTQLDLIPSTTGQFKYTFANARVVDRPRLGKWGLEALRWFLTVECIPANSNGTYSNQTLYTQTAV